MKNKLVIIGFMSGYTCYLNVEVEEAIDRYCQGNWPNGIWQPGYETREQIASSVCTEEFDDVFGAYDIDDSYRTDK